MKASSRIDGPICGAIRFRRPSSPVWSAAFDGFQRTPDTRWRDGASRSYHAAGVVGLRVHRRKSWGSSRRPLLLTAPSIRRFALHDQTFFSPSISSTCQTHTAAAVATASSAEHHHEDTIASDLPKPTIRSKEDLLSFVDEYDEGDVDECLRFFRDPYMHGYAPANDTQLKISNKQDDVDYPSLDEVQEPDQYQEKILWQLRFAVLSRLRSPLRMSLDNIYSIYQKLPEPRMPFINGRLRHQLLRALGQPEKKSSQSMLRYFSVITDVKNSGFALSRAEWNAAISFASRYVGTSTEVETEWALKLWREMEQDARIMGTDMTFNILFDVASKAGNFTLAEMIYKEMEDRGHRPNRYHYVSMIHFFGLKMDGSGVRAAYKEMVHAGQIIDTVALNCVIAGLLRSGEEASAERVYERMKLTDQFLPPLPERNYMLDKMVTKVLLMFSKLNRRTESKPGWRTILQSTAQLTPDFHTYRILINHFGVQLGDLSKAAKYLDEMRHFKIPLHGAIFLALFKGFHFHGGTNRTPWSEQRLNSVFAALLESLDEGFPGLVVKTWLAMWALRAFKKCTADNDQVLRAYEELEKRWDLDSHDQEFMADFLHRLLNK